MKRPYSYHSHMAKARTGNEVPPTMAGGTAKKRKPSRGQAIQRGQMLDDGDASGQAALYARAVWNPACCRVGAVNADQRAHCWTSTRTPRPSETDRSGSSFRHPSVLTSLCARAAPCRTVRFRRMRQRRSDYLAPRQQRCLQGWRSSPAVGWRGQARWDGDGRARRCTFRCCREFRRWRSERWFLPHRDGARRTRHG